MLVLKLIHVSKGATGVLHGKSYFYWSYNLVAISPSNASTWPNDLTRGDHGAMFQTYVTNAGLFNFGNLLVWCILPCIRDLSFKSKWYFIKSIVDPLYHTQLAAKYAVVFGDASY